MVYKSAKVKNLIKLKKLYSKNVPNFIIIQNKNDLNQINYLRNSKLYIIRPTLPYEDEKTISLAWFLKSIYPIKKNDIKNIVTKFNLNKYEIIVQEYIDWDFRWVMFTRNDFNILFSPQIKLSNKNNITSYSSWFEPNYFLKIELEELWYKIEKYFNYPQDVEFVIKNWKIFIVQTRPITSPILREQIEINLNWKWENIYKLWWIWFKISNIDELKQIDSYTKIIFDNLMPNKSIIINKNNIFVNLLWLLGELNLNLVSFFKYWKNPLNKFFLKYLNKKFLLTPIIKILFFQHITPEVLKIFNKYKNYSFDYNIINYKFSKNLFNLSRNLKEKLIIYLEKEKEKLFENIKTFVKNSSFHGIKKYKNLNTTFSINEKIIINFKGKTLFSIKFSLKEYIIYPGNFEQHPTIKLNKFLKNPQESIIYINSFSDIENWYKFIKKYKNFLKWIIIKNWNPLSHYAIILKENKIPSKIINS